MMKIKRYFIYIAIALAAASAFSCKDKDKDEEDESLPSLNGSLSIDMDSYDYVRVGDKIKATPHGVSTNTEDRSGVGFVWVVTDADSFRDTTKLESDPVSVTGEFEYTVPDTVGCITITCMAYAKGYQSISKSFTASIVSKEKSMEALNFSDKCKEFKDTRDNKVYKYETIGNLDWFCQNLAYKSDDVDAASFCDCEIMDDFFGKYYTWNQAVKACPEGWTLPSEENWAALAKAVSDKQFEPYQDFEGVAVHFTNDSYFNGKRMWEFWPETRPTFKTSLNVIPSGFATIGLTSNKYSFYDSVDTSFKYFCAMFWSADEHGSDSAFYRYIYNDKYPNLLSAYANKNAVALSVRCVRAAE